MMPIVFFIFMLKFAAISGDDLSLVCDRLRQFHIENGECSQTQSCIAGPPSITCQEANTYAKGNRR